MTYRETILNIANKIAERFDKVYHSAEIVINDNGIKIPAVSVGEEWIYLGPLDQEQMIYIRRNGDDDAEEFKLGSCTKAYRMRTSTRIVFFQDFADNHNKIISELLQSVLIQGVKLNRVVIDKFRLLKEESSADYNFGPTTAYFALDISVYWDLQPDKCDHDFCVDDENPIKKCVVEESS